MKTYQDLLEAQAKGKKELLSFILDAINEHKSSDMYKVAKEADLYMKHHNTFIEKTVDVIENVMGEKTIFNPDKIKCASGFFPMFVIQQNQYLLGNGVIFKKEDTKDKLGGDDDFDKNVQLAGEVALHGAISFGYYNYDHVEVFRLVDPNGTCFIPLWDEENGSLSAGIRFWQIDENKPLRVTLYEIDGYTDYIKRRGEDMTELNPKRTYKQRVRRSEIDGTEIYNGGNYPLFPIVPFWGNPEHQSELDCIKSKIDLYDLLETGIAQDEKEAASIYWTISNAGGMDKKDLKEFVENLKLFRAANTNENTQIEAHTVEVPYQSKEVYLTRLENDMYRDYMALNVRDISAGSNTATAIKASYEPMNNKADRYEYCVRQFIDSLLAVAGIEDKYTFKRSALINQSEETAMVLSAGLDRRTTVEHLPFISVDEREAVIERLEQEEMSRYDNAAVDENEPQENISETEGGEAVEIAEQVADKQLNGAQTQSLISIISQYTSGSLTLGQAVNIIAVAIGVTKEEAKVIIEGAE